MCRLLQLGIFLLAVGLLYALPRHANAELLPHFVLFYMLVAGFSIAGTAVTSLVSTLSKDNVGALIGVTQGVGEVAGTLSPIVSASLFAINSSSSSGAALVSFGDSIGQGSLPNVITATLLLLLLVVTPVPLRIIQGRLDDEHVKDDTAVTAPPPTAQTCSDAANAPDSA